MAWSPPASRPATASCSSPPSSRPACAYAVIEALLAAGVPEGVINFLPGEGDVGAALVAHPGVHTIAFTGSGAVGLEILKRSTDLAPGQRHLKRVVAEMGGKNCVIVDADADLDDAVPALAYSRLRLRRPEVQRGQPRALVHERIADALLERLHGAVEALLVDQAQRFGVDVPPVIEPATQERVARLPRRSRARRAGASSSPATPRSTATSSPPRSSTACRSAAASPRRRSSARCSPSSACATIDEACEIVSGQPFALTGGLFSRDPATVDRVSRQLPVGNLYVNRHITGAMVARQPFGGNRLSGTGTQGRRARLPPALRRAAGRDGGHDASRARRLVGHDAGVEAGLQEIVDALSVRLGRPVLVDDVDLRPLAYSIQFGELDAVRTESILGRTAPDAARDSLFGHGIRSALEPVRTPAHPEIGMEARICIPILRGGRRLGFLWLIEDPPVDRRRAARWRAPPSTEAAAILQSEADTQLDRRRREQELLRALLSPDNGASSAAAAVLEADHYVPPRPLIVIVGSGAAVPDAIDRFRARIPVKHALCGEIAGRATCVVGAQATMRGAQLAEALKSVAAEGTAPRRRGRRGGGAQRAPAPRTAARSRRCAWPSTATRSSPAGTTCAPTGC